MKHLWILLPLFSFCLEAVDLTNFVFSAHTTKIKFASETGAVLSKENSAKTCIYMTGETSNQERKRYLKVDNKNIHFEYILSLWCQEESFTALLTKDYKYLRLSDGTLLKAE